MRMTFGRRRWLSRERLGIFVLAILSTSVAFAQPSAEMLIDTPPGANKLLARMRVLRTRHYEIRTDIEPALANDLALRMDAMYDEYSRRLSDFRAPGGVELPLSAYLFNRHEDYDEFTGGRFHNTGGVFAAAGPAHGFLAAFLEGQGRDTLRRTLQHEAFHQFAFFHISTNIPVWLNEGLAQIFEEGIWSGKQFWLGQVPPRRLRQLKADIDSQSLMPFQKFTAVTSQEWADALTKDAARGELEYNQAWAMVHFLLYTPNTDLRPRFERMLLRLHKYELPDQAWTAEFSNNFKGFQDKFIDWAAHVKPTDEATMLERQDVLADFLTALHQNGQNFHDMNVFRGIVDGGHYEMRYTRGHVRWSTDPNPDVYFNQLNGQPFGRSELFFEADPGAPMWDIVCRPTGTVALRTRFYTDEKAVGHIDHEVLVEQSN